VRQLAGVIIALILSAHAMVGCADWTDDCKDWSARDERQWPFGDYPPMDPDVWARFEND
jgi:hypothetical protein